MKSVIVWVEWSWCGSVAEQLGSWNSEAMETLCLTTTTCATMTIPCVGATNSSSPT